MKILVTGSNGLLGQKLTDLILHTSHHLVATATGPNRHPIKDGYFYEVMDITDAKNVSQVIEKHQPDVIIHGAAMTQVDHCEVEKEKCDLLNVQAVINMVEAANKNGAHLIHLSTDFIFDGEMGPVKEDTPPHPLSYYAESKLKAEEYIKAHCLNYAIARTILVYGVVNDMSRSNVVLWAKNALEKGQEIKVVDDQFRTPTLAEDLAKGCLLIAEHRKTGIYHVSGPDFMSIWDLVNRVAEYWNLDKNLIKRTNSTLLNQAAKRPPITGFNIQKIKSETGYSPHTFFEGLALIDQQLRQAAISL